MSRGNFVPFLPLPPAALARGLDNYTCERIAGEYTAAAQDAVMDILDHEISCHGGRK